jgi:hypothetical protein
VSFIKVICGVVAGAIAVLAVPVAGNAQSVGENRANVAIRRCTSYLSTSGVETITGIASKRYADSVYQPVHSDPFPNRLGGAQCSWLATSSPWDGGNWLDNDAFLNVGYGVSQKSWNEQVSAYRAGGEFEDIGTSHYSPLGQVLGVGTQGFLDAVDMWSTYGEAAPFPEYLYAVTVLTRHHNAFQVAFMNVDPSESEMWVINLLKKDPSL